MDISSFGPPAPGSTHPGDLYVDLQSRTLWLGVDAAVDPTESVLISDIAGLLGTIDQAEADANQYTRNALDGLLPSPRNVAYSKVNHTHTADQITDFTGAVTDIASNIPGLQFVRGMIMMWSGTLPEIGTGPLAGWALCDGSNGTPNLRDRFIIGAGNKLPGATNPNGNFNVGDGGSHTHVVNGFALTVAHMPSHKHGDRTGYVSNDHQHYVSGNTGTESADHVHSGILRPTTTKVPAGGATTAFGGVSGNSNGRSAAHFHGFSAWSGGASDNHYHAIAPEGGNTAHAHTLQSGGVHTHNVTSAQLRDSLPYYALAFIMKL